MADKAAEVKVISDKDELPGGLIPEKGESMDEAMQGLYDVLGSEGEEFAEEPEDEGSPSGAEEETRPAGSEEDDELEDEDPEADLDDDEEFEEDESDDGDEGDDERLELSDDTLIEGVPLPGGETTEVTLAELKLGYSRQADYTRKTQALAAEHDAVMTEAREIRDQYKERLTKVQEIMSRMGPQKPDPALRMENPGEYAAQLGEYQAFQESLKAVEGATETISTEEQQEIAQRQAVAVQREWQKVVQEVPEWNDPAKATQELAALRQYAIDDYGFTPQEIDSLTDSRLLLMLKRNYDLQQTRSSAAEKVEEKKAKAKKRLKAGGRKTKASAQTRKRKAQEAADRRAAESGNVMDAARAIELALDD